jgi:hypothetical protein
MRGGDLRGEVGEDADEEREPRRAHKVDEPALRRAPVLRVPVAHRLPPRHRPPACQPPRRALRRPPRADAGAQVREAGQGRAGQGLSPRGTGGEHGGCARRAGPRRGGPQRGTDRDREAVLALEVSLQKELVHDPQRPAARDRERLQHVGDVRGLDEHLEHLGAACPLSTG